MLNLSEWSSIFELANQLAVQLSRQQLNLATAESCTGGGIAYAITHVPGSSSWYLGGISAYSNCVKETQLGVDPDLIRQHGAVSEQVALAMAVGASTNLSANIGISTSGIAGPDGGSLEKPVGTVCFGWSICGNGHFETVRFKGDREAVRQRAIEYSLKKLLQLL